MKLIMIEPTTTSEIGKKPNWIDSIDSADWKWHKKGRKGFEQSPGTQETETGQRGRRFQLNRVFRTKQNECRSISAFNETIRFFLPPQRTQPIEEESRRRHRRRRRRRAPVHRQHRSSAMPPRHVACLAVGVVGHALREARRTAAGRSATPPRRICVCVSCRQFVGMWCPVMKSKSKIQCVPLPSPPPARASERGLDEIAPADCREGGRAPLNRGTGGLGGRPASLQH
jgi:hypothetical protein